MTRIEGRTVMSQGKVGRPKADRPKDIRFSIRLDDELSARLILYCEEHNISKGEAIRKGLNLLFENN